VNFEELADPGCSGTGGSLAAAAPPRRRAARSPGARRTGTAPLDGAVRALPVFSQHVLQHRSIQRQLRHQLRQSAILVLELLELADLIALQPAVMFFQR
jgi:hypothetical protein